MPDKKRLAVLGATGHQGGSVIRNVLADPNISSQYTLRAITRDPSSTKAQALATFDLEVVQADVGDAASLAQAFQDVTFLFIATVPSFGPNAVQDEVDTIKHIADTAVAAKVEYIIFSTLPHVSSLSAGKYTAITPFDAKALGEEYIRSLPGVKSAFFAGGYFMENFAEQPFLAPRKSDKGDGTYVLQRNVPGWVKLPYINASEDAGKFVNAILASPAQYEGKVFCAADGLYTLEEIAGIIGRTSKKEVRFEEVSDEEFGKQMPFMADVFVQGYRYKKEFGGYFGEGTDEKVKWAKEQVGSTLMGLEEYLEKHPVALE